MARTSPPQPSPPTIDAPAALDQLRKELECGEQVRLADDNGDAQAEWFTAARHWVAASFGENSKNALEFEHAGDGYFVLAGMMDEGQWKAADRARFDARLTALRAFVRILSSACARQGATTQVAANVEPPVPTGKPSEIRIFISHSSEDVELARRLVTMFEAALSIPERAIRCTSVPGFKLEAGDDAAETLRENLNHCAIVVGLLTPASLASRYVLMELGAAWGFKKRVCQLLSPGTSFTDLPGPFSRIHALKMTDETDIADLLDTVSRHAVVTQREGSARVQAALREFVNAAAAVTPASVAATTDLAVSDYPTTQSGDEAVLRLRHWLGEQSRRGRRVSLSSLETELGLASGLAKSALPRAVEERHALLFGEDSVYFDAPAAPDDTQERVDLYDAHKAFRGG